MVYLNSARLSGRKPAGYAYFASSLHAGDSPWKQNLVMNCPFCFHASKELTTPLITFDSPVVESVSKAQHSSRSLLTSIAYCNNVNGLPGRCALFRIFADANFCS